MKKAIFFDKDNTLIENIPYNIDPKKISLKPDAIEALNLLKDEGYIFIIVSNQSGVAKGMFREEQLTDVTEDLRRRFKKYKISFDGFYYCPHHETGEVPEYTKRCECRKPMPGMIKHAAQEHNIDLHSSWMIGDILNDVEAGHRAGCRSILIDNGGETEWIMSDKRMPDFVARNLLDAASHVVSELHMLAITDYRTYTYEKYI